MYAYIKFYCGLQISQEDIESAITKIDRNGIHYANQIDLRFPKCCRIIVKRISSNPECPLDQKLEIKGTTSMHTNISLNGEPFLVDLLDLPSHGFTEQQIQPGMLKVIKLC